MNRIEVINTFFDEMATVKERIKESPYKTVFFMELVGLKQGLFYKKMKNGTFTAKEMKKMAPYLFPEDQAEYDKRIISKLLDQSEQEYKKGNFKSHKEIVEKTRKLYGL
ncbi:MAG: hypothetical protein ACON4A_07740 [Flavobacteriaceae bacterium]